MLSFNIPVSMIRQFYFCRRIPYFHLLRELTVPNNAWVNQGISHHEKVQMLLKRRNLEKFGVDKTGTLHTQEKLYDDSLKLYGTCDGYIQTGDTVIPLEFKTHESIKFIHGSELQLMAYGLLLEKRYCCKIERGFILYGSKGKLHEVIFREELREKVINTVITIENDYKNSLIPQTDASIKKCAQCEFYNFCGDR